MPRAASSTGSGDKPTVQEALESALQRIAEEKRDDLLAKLLDELWLILRFPQEQFPDGPPQELVESMRERRVARWGESAA